MQVRELPALMRFWPLPPHSGQGLGSAASWGVNALGIQNLVIVQMGITKCLGRLLEEFGGRLSPSGGCGWAATGELNMHHLAWLGSPWPGRASTERAEIKSLQFGIGCIAMC